MERNLRRLLKIFLLVILPGILLSCTCSNPLIVTPIQKTDKKLACKDVILEINEAEHYRDLAKAERGIGFGNMLMPVCWVTSYTNAAKAVKAAETRIAYLGNIYDVLDCGGKSDGSQRDVIVGEAAAPFIQIKPGLQPQQMQNAPLAGTKSDPAPKSAEGQCVTEEDIKKYTHKHVDKFGRTYTHCHINSGPHRHLEDQ